jgi:hypothetical protein
MRMKGIGGCLMVLLLTSMAAFAQEQGSGDDHQPPSVEDIVAQMQSKLNLTQDQVTAITPIIEKYSSKREEIRQSMEDGTADRDSMRSQMKVLKKDEAQDLSQVLSSDQMSQWEQMMGRHKQHNNGDGGGGDSGSGNGNNNEGGGNGT